MYVRTINVDAKDNNFACHVFDKACKGTSPGRWARTHFGRPCSRAQVGYVLVRVAAIRGRLIWIPGSRHSCHAR